MRSSTLKPSAADLRHIKVFCKWQVNVKRVFSTFARLQGSLFFPLIAWILRAWVSAATVALCWPCGAVSSSARPPQTQSDQVGQSLRAKNIKLHQTKNKTQLNRTQKCFLLLLILHHLLEKIEKLPYLNYLNVKESTKPY